MFRRPAIVALGLLAAAAGVSAPVAGWAQSGAAAPKTETGHKPKWAIERFTLQNGLRVVLAPDASVPQIAISVVYDVGSRNEERGRTGFAHLFEHMMFQGSRNVVRGEHFKLVTSHGGLLNGTTSADRTAYFEVLPKNEIALGLWLEADRMKSLDVSVENFENQRAVVKEELRMRVDNQPYVPAQLRLQELVFRGYFPYEHAEPGSMRDLDAARFEWVKAFHDSHYAPNNAVLAIAGDFEVPAARALVERYFGNIGKKVIARFDPGPLPETTEPRDAIVLDAHAAFPAMLDGWVVPPSRDPEHAALDVAAHVICDGDSSRLVRTLVHDRALAAEVDCGTTGRRGPDMFALSVKLAGAPDAPPKPGVKAPRKLDMVSKLVETELARLAKEGPTEAELQRVRARLVAQALLGLESPHARAERLAEFELFYGDARLALAEIDRLLAVGKEDVKRAVAKHLVRERRSRVEVRPESKSPATPAAPAPAAPGRGP